RQKYIYIDEPSDKAKGETPFKDNDYLDRQHWESFVASVDTEEWKKKSKKARNRAKQNIDPAHVGRCGYIGLEPHVESRWNQLVSSYPHLEAIGRHPGSRTYTVSRARLNPVTKLYELGEDLISNGELRGTLKLLHLKEKQLRDEGSYHTKDVALEVLRKGRKHTGPTQRKFSEQKTKKKKGEAVETTAGEIPGIRSMGHIYLLKANSIKKCEILHHDDQGALKAMGLGRVNPSHGRVIHGCPMVYRVVEGYGSTSLLPESCIPGEEECFEDEKGSFIQWTAKLIKVQILNKDSPQIVEPSHHVMSTPYRPQVFEATSTHQQQTIPHERNEYQIYSYALQNEEAFSQLLTGEEFSQNATEHTSFNELTEPVNVNQPTKPVHAYQHTKSVNVSQPTKTVHTNQPTEPIHDYQHTKPVAAFEPSIKKHKHQKKKLKSRPQSIYGLAQHVAIQSEKALFMVFISPTGMYEERIQETVEFEMVLQLCVNGWADACFVHWFTMYLYTAGGREGLNNTTYFHPRYIEGELVSDDSDFVIDHLRQVISFHKDKQWFMAPYLVRQVISYLYRKHWVLILLQHHPVYKTWKGYIFESRKDVNVDYSDYEITQLFEHATKQNITWEMVNLVNKTTMVRKGEIDEFVERTLKCHHEWPESHRQQWATPTTQNSKTLKCHKVKQYTDRCSLPTCTTVIDKEEHHFITDNLKAMKLDEPVEIWLAETAVGAGIGKVQRERGEAEAVIGTGGGDGWCLVALWEGNGERKREV
ncbi:LOW QUALITY PROTEIN: hypothetical protein M8C21_002237, partial [Ambrosia artemisiifolia]